MKTIDIDIVVVVIAIIIIIIVIVIIILLYGWANVPGSFNYYYCNRI